MLSFLYFLLLVDPGFYSTNQLMLAKSYMKINKMDPAKYWFQKLLTFHAKTEEDLKVRR